MTDKLHRFTIKAGLSPTSVAVEIDGEPLHGVIGIDFSLSAEKFTKLNLSIMGEVFVEGEFRPKELARIRRDMMHPADIRLRIRRAMRELFVGADDKYIDALARRALRDIETQEAG